MLLRYSSSLAPAGHKTTKHCRCAGAKVSLSCPLSAAKFATSDMGIRLVKWSHIDGESGCPVNEQAAQHGSRPAVREFSARGGASGRAGTVGALIKPIVT